MSSHPDPSAEWRAAMEVGAGTVMFSYVVRRCGYLVRYRLKSQNRVSLSSIWRSLVIGRSRIRMPVRRPDIVIFPGLPSNYLDTALR